MHQRQLQRRRHLRHDLASGWCLIGGACYSDGAQQPGESCRACRPSIATTTFSAVQNGTSCNDGQLCTSGDQCTGGSCLGTPYTCNDGLACTVDTCKGDGTCLATIAGTCLIHRHLLQRRRGARQRRQRLPSSATKSGLSQRGWYPNDGATCDDGAACTQGDHCSGSACGGAAYSCDDQNACTIDSCNGNGTCNHVQATDTCIIGGTCYAAGTAKPGEPCLACRPDVSPSTWSAVAPGSPCSDGNACTKNDQCNAGLCNGTAYTCNDGLACTADACDGSGGCTATVNAGSCAIEGACYSNGALKTAGGCLVCASAQSPTAWYPNNGAACNDGAACTKSDTCLGSTCIGTGYSCDDSLACTSDSCNGDGSCGHAQVANTCLIGGVCYAANTTKPGEPCLQCRPDVSGTTWSPVQGTVSCNDGNACTKSDTCSAGSCVGTTYTCNDGLTCTTDACNGDGTCSATPTAGNCAIAGACWANGATDPTNPCKVCNSTTNPTGWSNKSSGTSCSDGNSCTKTDQCNASGTCVGTAYSCDDSQSCTTDNCDGSGGCTHPVNSGCSIGGQCVSANAFNPSNPCQQCLPAVSTTAWSANTGNTCNDGNSCTHTDRCSSGVCGGTAYSCNDNLTCTTDTCNGSGGCSNSLNSGNCLISGTCYANTATMPGNVCFKCNTASSTTSWSLNNGVSCDDADSCSDGDTCSSGVCDGTDRGDIWEPNDNWVGAYTSDIDDGSPQTAHTLSGSIYGPADTDWYWFTAYDATSSELLPRVSITGIPTNIDVDLDVYFTCKNGASLVSFDCVSGYQINGANGLVGCRSDNVGNNSELVVIDACCTEGAFGIDCTGDDSGYIDVWVHRWVGSMTCSQSYTLGWGND
ncbi:MAG: hypothetical protein U1F43_35650 [Myxococcota bacterium]